MELQAAPVHARTRLALWRCRPLPISYCASSGRTARPSSAQQCTHPRAFRQACAAAPPSQQQQSGDGGGLRDLPARLPADAGLEDGAAIPGDDFDWKSEVTSLAQSLAAGSDTSGSSEEDEARGPERVFLVGVSVKSRTTSYAYTIDESLEELARLAETAGLEVVGSAYQQLQAISPRSYIGSGKVTEILEEVRQVGAETVIFDDELSPGQQRSLERLFENSVRLGDRTALILDIFGQRAATREGQLQVELAKSAYQLPRLTRMWSHLERQAGGRTKGMGEKQIEVDKRILRNRMATLRSELEEVRAHRKQQRTRRAEATIPVIGLCGYTNSGKSTLLNRMSGSESVLAEDALFATLDPTTRRIELASGKQALLTDTVGFIQKLPTQLIAAFRATLEEIGESSLLLHVVDVSSRNAAAQTDTVTRILADLGVDRPIVTVWNKVDLCADPDLVRRVAAGRDATVCVSALTGEAFEDLADEIERQLSMQMSHQKFLIPYHLGEVVSELHQQASILHEEYVEDGTLIEAFVPPSLASRLQRLNLQPLQPAEGSDAEGELLTL